MLVKRAIDCCGAVAVLTVSLPVLIVLAILIRIRLGKPILFSQIRPGRYGKPIRIYKFRSMTNERDDRGVLLPDAQRLTSFGKFLRSASLDELPQMWSVLRGDLSLVGPRPLLMAYLDRYTPDQARRHEVMPGITGWAQINGRNGLSWETKFQYDIWYVDHWSLALDAVILVKTVMYVLKRQGVSHQSSVTMPEFQGRMGQKS